MHPSIRFRMWVVLEDRSAYRKRCAPPQWCRRQAVDLEAAVMEFVSGERLAESIRR